MIADLSSLRDALDEVLQPYLYAATPSMDFSEGEYICLKARSEAFTTGAVPPLFHDITKPDGWHIHLSTDFDHDRALILMLRYLKPELVDALRPALFRWKLEGGG